MNAANPDGSAFARLVLGVVSRGIWVVLLAGVGLGLYLAFFRGTLEPLPSRAPRDPRLDYTGPFRNVDPAVKYVSDKRCADCHQHICQSYAEHPMGRSLQRVARAVPPPEGARFHNPFEAFGSRFLVDHPGGAVRHRRIQLAPDGRPAAELEWKVDYVLGSGRRGHSYLTDQKGYLFQTPVSWYSQKKVWDLAPGFGPALLTGRAVLPECLFCHANRANHRDGSVNQYTQPVFDGVAIGCQRCHGPGELHVASRERVEPLPDKVDYTIVNPRHLEPPLREAVCQQCHLTGKVRVLRRGRGLYDFRPGLPFDVFCSVFVRSSEGGEESKAVSHVEQMYQSRCFQGSVGPNRLGCISCHDPHEHEPPAKRVAHYRARCLQCHQQHGCSLPRAERLRQTAEDSCIACHMARYGSSDIPHTASTDHRILRRGKPARTDDGARKEEKNARVSDPSFQPLVSFYGSGKGAGTVEEERDRAVALVLWAFRGEPDASRALRHTLTPLEAAVGRDPDDWDAGEARGYALGLQGRSAEALAAFKAVLARAPDREMALGGAAAMAEALGQTEAALGYWQRAVEANPWAPDYRGRLVRLLVKKKAWVKALPQCQAWLRLDPCSAEARVARVQCLLAAGNKAEARAEFSRVEALAPPNLREYQIRFGKKLK
jgi:hypothetical protein